MKTRFILFMCAAVVCSGLWSTALRAQEASGSERPGPDVSTETGAELAEPMTLREALERARTQAEPIRRAGIRASLIERSGVTADTVVIVETPSQMLDAVAGWEWPVRYPVLYDDNTVRAREQIARFVRAFRPERVVRVRGDTGTALGESWGETSADRERAVRTALARSVRDTMGGYDEALAAMGTEGLVSPGVVVIDVDDALWAGGLALAAGRAQGVVFVSTDDDRGDVVSESRVRSLSTAIESALRERGVSWDEIGDDIDAVTLAMELSVRAESGDSKVGIAASTDMIGRHGGGRGERWAHSGQLYGSVSDGVYQAMCSLFLPLDSAWVWDGYQRGGDWDRYDGTKAGELLEAMGIEAAVRDAPRNTLRAFELASASEAVDASLLLMNSKGTRLYYDLPGAPEGQGRPGDLPVLARPAALHMVHSFSLQRPEHAYTVGARWLSRGVFVYAGSVDEPFLSGFVPTPDVVRRLGGSLAFAAAVHYDNAPVWKIAVIGDPLKTASPAPTRAAAGTMSLPESDVFVDVDERMKSRLAARDLNGAMVDLSVLGDDDALVRLAKAALKDASETLKDDGLMAALHAAVRGRDHELALDLYERLSARSQRSDEARDMLWLAGRSRLARLGDTRAFALMRANLRNAMRVRDAVELAQHVKNTDSLRAGLALLASVRGELDRDWELKKLDQAVERLKR